MSTWTSDELDRIGGAEELQLASLRPDGTLRGPVTIWVVRHGDAVYVRPVNGRTGRWFRGALDRHEGHITAGGVDKDVAFVEVDGVNDEVDEAYRSKYGGRYPASFIDAVIGPEPRAATLELVPCSTDR